ncbi:MAG: hypothetical protein HY554_00020 [Elusimicrobia bacterium]|nr:hypothetical protein [Elusimicrobiota bacterium]
MLDSGGPMARWRFSLTCLFFAPLGAASHPLEDAAGEARSLVALVMPCAETAALDTYRPTLEVAAEGDARGWRGALRMTRCLNIPLVPAPDRSRRAIRVYEAEGFPYVLGLDSDLSTGRTDVTIAKYAGELPSQLASVTTIPTASVTGAGISLQVRLADHEVRDRDDPTYRDAKVTIIPPPAPRLCERHPELATARLRLVTVIQGMRTVTALARTACYEFPDDRRGLPAYALHYFTQRGSSWGIMIHAPESGKLSLDLTYSGPAGPNSTPAAWIGWTELRALLASERDFGELKAYADGSPVSVGVLLGPAR